MLSDFAALFLESQKEIKPEEYTEFYKFHANAFDEPRMRLHFSADAPIAINSLLFVPKDNMERMGFNRTEIGVSLYCRNILIDSKPEGLLPEWLRFLRGVVDSADLPLNISRETMQDSALVKRLNTVLTKRSRRSEKTTGWLWGFLQKFQRLPEGRNHDWFYTSGTIREIT